MVIEATADDLVLTRAWKNIWSAGQSVGAVARVEPTAQIVARLRAEYDLASRLPAFGG